MKLNKNLAGAWPEGLLCPTVFKGPYDKGTLRGGLMSEQGSHGGIGGRVFPAQGAASANGLGVA